MLYPGLVQEQVLYPGLVQEQEVLPGLVQEQEVLPGLVQEVYPGLVQEEYPGSVHQAVPGQCTPGSTRARYRTLGAPLSVTPRPVLRLLLSGVHSGSEEGIGLRRLKESG